MSTLTKGFVRYEKWGPQKYIRMFFGLKSPDSTGDDFRGVMTLEYMTEAVAQEFVKRWNAYEALVAAAQRTVDAHNDFFRQCQGSNQILTSKGEPISVRVLNVARYEAECALKSIGEYHVQTSPMESERKKDA
jgi:hypothetical protein